MIKNIFFNLLLASLVVVLSCCKDQLDVGNPNSPTIADNVTSEAGLIALASGSVYETGFVNGYSWLGDSYFSLCYGYMELMGDMVGAQASNQLISTMSIPDYFILDDGTKITNSSPSISIMRANNTRAQTGSGYNPTYYQWMGMYDLNMACNEVINLTSSVTYSSDATVTAQTIRAWAYFWKGYAYAAIGSLYYSGLIVDNADSTNSNYVTHDVIIERSDYYYKLASSTLDSISNESTYENILGQLIPSFCQVEHGGVLTVDMWKRNINTMLARNIVANNLAPFINGNLDASIGTSTIGTMTSEDWTEVLTLTTEGIQDGDFVFTGQTVANYGFISATGGTVAAMTTTANTGTTFKLGERFVQNFKSTDQRLQNFNTETTYNDDMTFGTRYSITDSLIDNDSVSIYDYGSQNVGEYELYIAGSYEENAMMLAEANIRLGNIEEGLEYVDAVRAYMGAGVAAVAGTSLTQAEAMTELVAERRVALAFRGLSFYDYRRWGIIYDIENGGGSYGNTIWYGETEYTNATINYDFLDYWDVPADESVLNPSTSDVATENPNF